MQNFKVVLKDSSGDVVVPNTGTLTNVNNNYTSESVSDASALGITILSTIVALLFIAFIVIRRIKKGKGVTKRSILPVAVILPFLALSVSLYSDQQSNISTVSAANNELTITIDNVTMEAELSNKDTFMYAPGSIRVTTATNGGYTLSAYAKSSALTGENSGKAITSVAGNNVALTENTWGIATTKPTDQTSTVWRSLSTDTNNPTLLVNKTSATLKDDITTIYYGINVNNKLEPDTYSNTIVYTAVANVMPGITYNDNGANSPTAMGVQPLEFSDTEVTLWASNYQRTDNSATKGYGFAGWSTTKIDPDATDAANQIKNAKIYGPNETVAVSEVSGKTLYAVWVKSAGSIQNWNGCSSMNIGEVTALIDQRDNDTYAVAKLKDGKCWMIENLRLDNTNSDNTTGLLAQGYASNFVGLAAPEAPWATEGGNTTANSLYNTDGSDGKTAITGSYNDYRFPRYNNYNTISTVANMTIPTDASIYSYGNYYTWPIVVADTGNYTTNNQTIENTSICPKGWKLPSGGDDNNAANSDFRKLAVATIGAEPNDTRGTNRTMYYNKDGGTQGTDASKAMRRYPGNFIYSGRVYRLAVLFRGSFGDYWSSTVCGGADAYRLSIYSGEVDPGTYSSYKDLGRTVRCFAGV